MAVSYPSDLPAPRQESLGFVISMGVIRADGPTDQVQRRVFNTMPHTFALSFVMTVAQWATWNQWVMANAYDWFNMDLPTAYAGLSDDTLAPVLIRFVSGMQSITPSADTVQITVNAEMAPSMFGQYLATL